MRTRGLAAAMLAALALGALSTLGDWVWARFIPDGAVLPGLAHGVVFFIALSLVLGRAAARPLATRRLLAALPLVGLAIAAAFYPVASLLGYLPALLVAWVAMWLVLAFALRWATGAPERRGRALGRALLAALGSGLTFWAVSGMWTGAGPASYPVRWLWWTFALFPGFAALLLARAADAGEPI